MIRPRLALAVLALAALGLANGAEASAADAFGLLLAQSGTINELRGPGLYLNLFKFVPVLLIFLLWVPLAVLVLGISAMVEVNAILLGVFAIGTILSLGLAIAALRTSGA